MDPVVVLCSGGLKSAVAAALAAQDQPAALLHVRCGHLASKREEKAFEALAARMQSKHVLTVDMPHLAAAPVGSRFGAKGDVKSHDGSPEALARLHIPGLLISLAGAAATWATALRARRIVMGIAEPVDGLGHSAQSYWPDHSRDFVHVMCHLLGVIAPDLGLELEAPLLELSLADVIRLGQSLNVPLDQTWSCFADVAKPCGTCAGCMERARAFVSINEAEPAAAMA